MTTTTVQPQKTTRPARKVFSTSRITGLLYLGLAIAGVIGYLTVRAQLYVPDDGVAAAANIVNNETLARVGLVGELGIVAFQVLAAFWFFKLWRNVNSFAAGTLAGFGLMGAASVLVGLVFSIGALQVALDPASAPAGDQAATVLLMSELNDAAWTAGNLFFGLWLIPMGYLVIVDRMPRLLGWILVAGGVGYILSGVFSLVAPGTPATVVEAPAYLATVGEFWIIGYLLWDPRGNRSLPAKTPKSR